MSENAVLNGNLSTGTQKPVLLKTPKHVGAYIFYCGDCKLFFFYFTVVAVLMKGTETGTFW